MCHHVAPIIRGKSLISNDSVYRKLIIEIFSLDMCKLAVKYKNSPLEFHEKNLYNSQLIVVSKG